MDNRTIHDLGIDRNGDQQRDLTIALAILLIFFILWIVCYTINLYLSVCFFFTIVFWGYASNYYYKRSITPTEEQKKKFFKHGNK